MEDQISTQGDFAGSVVRDLGARGSRSKVSGPEPLGDLTPTAAAVLAAIPTWWAARARAAGLEGDWLEVQHAVDAASPVELGPDSFLDEAWKAMPGSGVGQSYVDALDPGTRARHGRHYTPDALAVRLWDMARRAMGRHRDAAAIEGLVRDPACGGGALLLAPLREHLEASRAMDPRVLLAGVAARFEGIDNDPLAVWIANVVLAAELAPVLARVPERRRQPLPALARVGDGLDSTLDPASVVLMNPPYGRVKLDPRERKRFESVIYGHANLYGLFLGSVAENLEADGVMAAVVPTSFTSGRYFSRLRAVLSESTPMREITFVSSRSGVFTGVLQETCLAVFAAGRTRKTRISVLDGEGVHTVASITGRHGENAWIVPRSAADAPVAAAAMAMPHTLASAGWRVSTGPLVWNRRRADLHPRPATGRVAVLWGADLDGGAIHRDASRRTMRYLDVADEERSFMVIDEPAVVVQRTTAPEQRRRLVVAELDRETLAGFGGEVVVENHVNVLRPAEGTEPLLDQRTLVRVLSTPTLDRLLRCISGSVAVSAYELESLRLPDPAVLSRWRDLQGVELDRAVAAAYTPR